jgi:hypothetical protein
MEIERGVKENSFEAQNGNFLPWLLLLATQLFPTARLFQFIAHRLDSKELILILYDDLVDRRKV